MAAMQQQLGLHSAPAIPAHCRHRQPAFLRPPCHSHDLPFIQPLPWRQSQLPCGGQSSCRRLDSTVAAAAGRSGGAVQTITEDGIRIIGQGGQIEDRELHEEASDSYLAYAMSVIVGRALPDVRDGLKPVHRRILYAMHDLGLFHSRPFKKCARVVGEVLGKYHPHGDTAVYDAMVRLAQNFSMRDPLISGHGNFGSLDDDPAAAMRYTECRLQAFASDMLLADLDQDVVDWAPTFDASQTEPTVLPAKVPHLLINGTNGIAVGIATKIPPHNMREVVEGLAALIRDPDISIEQLMTHIPGPDFPTGNVVEVGQGLVDTYVNGQGGVQIKATMVIESSEDQSASSGARRRRGAATTLVVIKDIPYQTSKSELVENIAKLVDDKVLEGVVDVRDESDRTAGVRVVVEVKAGASPEAVQAALYKHTRLEVKFSTNMVALVAGSPQQLNLKQFLKHFLDFRCEVVERRARHEQRVAQKKLDQVEGYLIAANHMDQVVQLIRSAPDASAARAQLMANVLLSYEQAEAVLSLALRRLTRMSVAELEEDKAKLTTRLHALGLLLADRQAVLAQVEAEAREVAVKHGTPRRSIIVQQAAAPVGGVADAAAAAAPSPPVLVLASAKGFLQKVSGSSTSATSSRAKGQSSLGLRAGDALGHVTVAPSAGTVIAVTPQGHAYQIKTASIPEQAARSHGASAAQVLGGETSIQIAGLVGIMLPPPTDHSSSGVSDNTVNTEQADADAPGTAEEEGGGTGGPQLVVVSRLGQAKRMELPAKITKKGTAVMRVKAGDEVVWAGLVGPGDHLVLGRSDGRVLRFPAEEIKLRSRAVGGVQAMTLGEGMEVVAATVLPHECLQGAGQEGGPWLAVVSGQSKGKRIPVCDFKVGSCNQVGLAAIKLTTKAGQKDVLAGLGLMRAGDELVVGVDQGTTTRLGGDTIKVLDHKSTGAALVALEEGQSVRHLTVLPWSGVTARA